jgi:hypothetical protein
VWRRGDCPLPRGRQRKGAIAGMKTNRMTQLQHEEERAVKISSKFAMMMGSAALALALAGSAAAADHSGHGGAAAVSTPAGQTAEPGVVIRTAGVEGYRLTYRLLNWKERNEAMKGMEGMEMAGMDNSGKATNHLVLQLAGADGKEVSGAKVGFQLTGPDGAEQKTLTMAMGGYGADVTLKTKGIYTIKTKFVVGGKTGADTFTYELK